MSYTIQSSSFVVSTTTSSSSTLLSSPSTTIISERVIEEHDEEEKAMVIINNNVPIIPPLIVHDEKDVLILTNNNNNNNRADENNHHRGESLTKEVSPTSTVTKTTTTAPNTTPKSSKLITVPVTTTTAATPKSCRSNTGGNNNNTKDTILQSTIHSYNGNEERMVVVVALNKYCDDDDNDPNEDSAAVPNITATLSSSSSTSFSSVVSSSSSAASLSDEEDERDIAVVARTNDRSSSSTPTLQQVQCQTTGQILGTDPTSLQILESLLSMEEENESPVADDSCYDEPASIVGVVNNNNEPTNFGVSISSTVGTGTPRSINDQESLFLECERTVTIPKSNQLDPVPKQQTIDPNLVEPDIITTDSSQHVNPHIMILNTNNNQITTANNANDDLNSNRNNASRNDRRDESNVSDDDDKINNNNNNNNSNRSNSNENNEDSNDSNIGRETSNNGSMSNSTPGNNDNNINNENTGTTTTNENNNNNSTDNVADGTSVTISYDELRYGMDSFYAIVQPVFLTMVLTALAVIYISTPEMNQQYEQGLAVYTVFDTGNADGTNTDSNTTKLGKSLVNSLVIVSVICAMTFVIVLLYKYNCMKFIWAYMIISNIILLGFLSGTMFQVAIERYQLYVDKISFYLFLYNLAVVGVIAIFASTKGGIPAFITQGYLILCSVIIAWQLSHFDDWTAWTLLIFLALYDLFAVLSPYGPLQALVKLMTKDNAPALPGLLYEANVNNNGPSTTTTSTATSNDSNGNYNNDNSQAVTTVNRESLTNSPVTQAPQNPLTTNGNNTNNLGTANQSPRQDDGRSSPSLTTYGHQLRTNISNNDEGENSDDDDDLLLLLSTSNDGSAISGPSLTDVSSMSSTSKNGQNRVSNSLLPPVETTSRRSSSLTLSRKPRVEILLNNPYLSPRNPDVSNDDEDGEYNEERKTNEDDENGSQNPSQNQVPKQQIATVVPPNRTGEIPYALAKLYRLPSVRDPQPPWIITQPRNERRNVLRPAQVVREEVNDEESVVSTSYVDPQNEGTSASESGSAANNDDDASVATVTFTLEQLTSLIEVTFPRNGGYLRKAVQQYEGQEVRWEVIDRNENLKRILFVNSVNGKIFEDLNRPGGPTDPNRRQPKSKKLTDRNSIRLGLGDFIFYSVLVSKAALYSFTTFASSSLAIITGLGLTLLLLAVFQKALPALPISIALGILFYLQTRYVMEPWIDQVLFLNQHATMYV